MQPHLHQIVLQSMSLANTTPEPCNYFLLLRALFRSIGGGSHEQLYQEFLPLLSNLLQGAVDILLVYTCSSGGGREERGEGGRGEGGRKGGREGEERERRKGGRREGERKGGREGGRERRGREEARFEHLSSVH